MADTNRWEEVRDFLVSAKYGSDYVERIDQFIDEDRRAASLSLIPLVDLIEYVQNQGYVVQEQADYDSMLQGENTINHFYQAVTHNHYTTYNQQ